MPTLTVRRLTVMVAALLAATTIQWSFAAESSAAANQLPPELEQNSIHQEVSFHCGAPALFKALTTANNFAAFTGYPAELVAQPGGKFSAFGGQITGMNIELQPTNIVQAWRVASWPAGTYSVVRFNLHTTGAVTTLVLDQAGFPTGTGEHLRTGWYDMYWNPLKKYCEK